MSEAAECGKCGDRERNKAGVHATRLRLVGT
jgi:hypothetical protein